MNDKQRHQYDEAHKNFDELSFSRKLTLDYVIKHIPTRRPFEKLSGGGKKSSQQYADCINKFLETNTIV